MGVFLLVKFDEYKLLEEEVGSWKKFKITVSLTNLRFV